MSTDPKKLTADELLSTLAFTVKSEEVPESGNDDLLLLAEHWPGVAEFVIQAGIVVHGDYDDAETVQRRTDFELAATLVAGTILRATQIREMPPLKVQ